MMRTSIIVSVAAEHHQRFARAMAAGIRAAGDDVEIVTADAAGPTYLEGRDVVIAWGWNLARKYVEAGKATLVADHGFIGDRKAWMSLAWNGINGRGTYPPNDPEFARARFERFHAGALKPWNPHGWYALIAGQHPGDAALHGVDLMPWYRRQARAFARAGLPCRFRPHPIAAEQGQVWTVEGAPVLNGSLEDAIDGARVVVTWSSNTAVDAVLAGKPTIAADRGSMAWHVTTRGAPWNPKELREPSPVPVTWLEVEPARDVWAHDLACKQWLIDELHDGSAWRYMTKELA